MLQFKKRVLSTVCKRQDQDRVVKEVEEEIVIKEAEYELEINIESEDENEEILAV